MHMHTGYMGNNEWNMPARLRAYLAQNFKQRFERREMLI